MRVGWVDATGGVSGDMLLGACLDAGVPLETIQRAIDAVGLPEQVTIGVERVVRGGLAAAHAVVSAPPVASLHRSATDVLALVTGRPHDVFAALAAAESRVHGVPLDEVHLHEVGALDSIADVVGVCAALDALGLDRLVCSPIALGGGRAATEHGPIPVPGPAVVELLRAHGVPAHGGPIDLELATPTGVALMAVLADGFGPLPPLTVTQVGVGAGTRDPAGHPNVVRLVVGETVGEGTQLPAEPAIVLEANVDDLDPRVWPEVLALLLDAGAADAWVTPIVMKKGRPAHTLSVLADPGRADALARLVLTHTSTIGLRRRPVDKIALPREFVTVEVLGSPVRVKIARLDGRIVNAEPEFADVADLARTRGIPVREVLIAARAAAHPAALSASTQSGTES